MCKGLPFVLCNAPLVEDPATWTLEFLTKQLRNRACSVLSCPAASHTFTVFRSGRQHEAYEAASDVSVELMGFDDFAEVARRQREGHFDGGRMRYLQTHLMERVYDDDDGASHVAPQQVPPGELRRRLCDAGRSPLMDEVQRVGGLGEWCLSTLWVSPAGARSRCHFDLHDNLLL